MKAQKGSRGIVIFFLYLRRYMWLGGQRHTPAALPLYASYRRLDGPWWWSGWVQKISAPMGFEPLTVRPVVSRYTDWAIPASQVILTNSMEQSPSWESNMYWARRFITVFTRARHLSPGLLAIFRNMINFLWWEVFSTSPKHQAGGPPFVGCTRLLIQNIRSYPPYLEAVPPSATWGRSMSWWQGPTYSQILSNNTKNNTRLYDYR
jgi:hypothetical protein